jgi:hypothetical protein
MQLLTTEEHHIIHSVIFINCATHSLFFYFWGRVLIRYAHFVHFNEFVFFLNFYKYILLYYYTNYMGDRGGKTTTGLVIDLRKIPLVLVIYICKKQTIGRYFSSDSTRSEETGGMFFLYKLRLIRIN